MPNWCNNYLSISGPAADVLRFVAEVKHKTEKDNPLSFNNHVPVWKDDKLIGDMDPINNWGTKWDACDAYYCAGPEEAALEEAQKGGLAYTFQSAWSPPCEWLKAVTKIFPTLDFEMEYEEGGCDVYGVSKASKGEFEDKFMTKEEYLEMSNDEYADAVQGVKKMSQEELIKYFSKIHNWNEWVMESEEIEDDAAPDFHIGYDFWPLGRHVIEAIETKNLPLFINVDWDDAEFNERFKQRVREGK